MIVGRHACPAMRFVTVTKNPLTATPLDSALTNCDGRKFFISCIYENCQVCTNNSHSGTHDSSPQEIAALSFHSLTNCPLFPRGKQPLCFHVLTNCPLRNSFVLTFMHRMGGVGGRPQAYLKKNLHCGRTARATNHLQGDRFYESQVTSHQSPNLSARSASCP